MSDLSIVIAAVHGPYSIDIIQNRTKGYDVEIILVVTNREYVREINERVQYVVADPNSSERQMRCAGLKHATGRSVAILGDRYEPGENWVRTAISSGTEFISGSVLPAVELSRSGWAIYLAEYSFYSGPVEGNVVNRPRLKNFTSPKFCPELSVFFARPPDWSDYLRERYRDSREWARQQCSGDFLLGRCGKAASRIGLPMLLIFRRAGGPYPLRFVAALPYLLVSTCVEAAGEIAGFLSGEM